MSVRPVSFVTGEYYHIYNRGNGKQIIFHDEQDHVYFMNLLNLMNSEKRTKSRDPKESMVHEEKLVSIGAFCLMPNHFHILAKQEKDKGISLFMQKVSTAYVMYYNKKYKHLGGLFEGKFKSKYAGEDRYLKYLFSYIHLNPLKLFDKNWKVNPIGNEKFQFLSHYPYSSFFEYQTGQYVCIDKNYFPDYFPSQISFMQEVKSWFSLGE